MAILEPDPARRPLSCRRETGASGERVIALLTASSSSGAASPSAWRLCRAGCSGPCGAAHATAGRGGAGADEVGPAPPDEPAGPRGPPWERRWAQSAKAPASLDDRLPLRGLGLGLGPQRRRGHLLGRDRDRAEVGEALDHLGVLERRVERGGELLDGLGRGAGRRPQRRARPTSRSRAGPPRPGSAGRAARRRGPWSSPRRP